MRSCGLPRLFGGKDGPADQFGNLRDYGVSEPMQRVWPFGKPIMYSTTRTGGYCSPKCHLNQSRKLLFGPRSSRFRPLPLKSQAVGVGRVDFRSDGSLESVAKSSSAFLRPGDKPEPVSVMMGANGGRWNTIPPRIVPERGHVSENVSKPSTKESCDVFHEDVTGSNFVNESGIFAPEPRPLAGEASALSGKADVLAGEPATDGIDADPVPCEAIGGESAHVVIGRHPRPMMIEEVPALRVDLAKGDSLKPTRALQPEAEAANPAEQVEDAQAPLASPVVTGGGGGHG